METIRDTIRDELSDNISIARPTEAVDDDDGHAEAPTAVLAMLELRWADYWRYRTDGV